MIPDDERWLSQRFATGVLADMTGISVRQARGVLAAGLAGEPVRERGVLLYHGARILALMDRVAMSEAELDDACPHGLFVARRRPSGPGWAGLTDGWRFSPWTAVWLKARIEQHGFLPMVATIGGFVVATADLVGAWTDGTLDLREPGAWSALFAERRVPTGPGRDWWIRGLDKARGRLPA